MTRLSRIPTYWAVACLAVACGGHEVTPTGHASPTPTGPIASNLPSTVCAPTYEQLRNPEATRIEAKLVTFATASSSDPNFPPAWESPPRSAYFWVVAESGTFVAPPHDLGMNTEPVIFHFSLGYVQAVSDSSDPETISHPCRGIGGSLNRDGPWPAWFDQMPALADVKIQ